MMESLRASSPEASPTGDSPLATSPTKAFVQEASVPEVFPMVESLTEAALLKASPPEASPTEASQAEATPSKTAPANAALSEAAPAEATPAEVKPAMATPAEATSAEATPRGASPAQATQAEATPAEATLADATPAEATPSEATLAEATPAEATPAEATPAEATPAENVQSPSLTDLVLSSDDPLAGSLSLEASTEPNRVPNTTGSPSVSSSGKKKENGQPLGSNDEPDLHSHEVAIQIQKLVMDIIEESIAIGSSGNKATLMKSGTAVLDMDWDPMADGSDCVASSSFRHSAEASTSSGRHRVKEIIEISDSDGESSASSSKRTVISSARPHGVPEGPADQKRVHTCTFPRVLVNLCRVRQIRNRTFFKLMGSRQDNQDTSRKFPVEIFIPLKLVDLLPPEVRGNNKTLIATTLVSKSTGN